MWTINPVYESLNSVLTELHWQELGQRLHLNTCNAVLSPCSRQLPVYTVCLVDRVQRMNVSLQATLFPFCIQQKPSLGVGTIAPPRPALCRHTGKNILTHRNIPLLFFFFFFLFYDIRGVSRRWERHVASPRVANPETKLPSVRVLVVAAELTGSGEDLD